MHLELPEDIAREDADTPLFPRDRVRRPIPEEKAIARAAALIEGAQSPPLAHRGRGQSQAHLQDAV